MQRVNGFHLKRYFQSGWQNAVSESDKKKERDITFLLQLCDFHVLYRSAFLTLEWRQNHGWKHERLCSSVPQLPPLKMPLSQLHGISDTYIVSENDRILDSEVTYTYCMDTLLAGFRYVFTFQYWCVYFSPLRAETRSWTTRFLHYFLQCRLSPNFQGSMVSFPISKDQWSNAASLPISKVNGTYT